MLDEVFDVVENNDADAHAVWVTALSLALQALRHTDEFNRERLLRGVERDLREDLVEFDRQLEARNHAS